MLSSPLRYLLPRLILWFLAAWPLAGYAQCPVAASCTPGAASDPNAQFFGMGIYQVQIGTINNSSGGYADGYRDYSCTTGTTLTAGGIYSISIRTGSLANENVRVWIDYDNNGILNATTELFFSSNNAQLHAGNTLAIPAAAVLNTPLRLRVSADATTSPLPTPCSTPQFSQVEDYAVTIQGNTLAPIAAFSVRNAANCSGVFQFTDQSQQGPTTWEWDFGDGSARSTQQNPTHTYAPGTYSVRLRVCNANGCDTLRQTNIVQLYSPLTTTACPVPTTAPCCGYGITRVDFAGQTQLSADGTAGYEDFSCLRRFTVQQNNRYSISLLTGPLQHAVRIWLDLNNDGTFATTELIFDRPQTVNPTGSVLIPSTGVVNTPLRMRIIADLAGNTLTSCTAPQVGQAEDYSVIVLPNAGSCTVLQPLPPVLGSYTLCPGDSSLLMVPNPQPGVAFQWQTSPDSLTWTPVLGAIGSSYRTPPITIPTYFRVVANCGAVVRASAARRILLNTRLCYCRNTTIGGNCYPGASPLFQRVWMPRMPLDSGPLPCTTSDSIVHVLGTNPPSQPTVLMAGENYEFRFLLAGSGPNSAVAWIDYNQDGNFDYTESLGNTIFTTAADTGVLFFTVPINAQPGETGLRVRTPFVESCDLSYGGDVRDFTITIAPRTCQAPLQPGYITGPSRYCPGDRLNLQLLNHTRGTDLQWQTSPDSLTWTAIPGATGRLLTNFPLRDSLYVRVRVTCGTTTAFTAAYRVRPDFQRCYCTPPYAIASTCRQTYLRRLRIGNTTLLSAGTNCPVPNYTLYPPAQPTNTARLLRGLSYPVYIRPELNGSPTWTNGRTFAWIDYNQDGTFSDGERTEFFWTPTDSASTLTVPPDARLGTTRMRVLTRTPNDDFSGRALCTERPVNGQEIREYLVTIAAPTPPAGLPVAGSISGPTAVCAGDGARLTAQGYSYGAQLRWEVSNDNGATWNGVPIVTGPSLFTGPITFPLLYRFRAFTAAGSSYSAPITIAPTAPCPCRTFLGGDAFDEIRRVAISGPNTFLLNRNDTLFFPSVNSCYTHYQPDRDSLLATVYPGRTYKIFTKTYAASPNTINFGIWLDYNRNGDFEPTEATLVPQMIWLPDNPLTITLPATLTPGPLAIRLRSSYYGLTTNACRSIGVNHPYGGETEDYTLLVADPPAFVAPELAAPDTVCQGGTIRLSVTTPLPPGCTYLWESPTGWLSNTDQAVRYQATPADAGYYYLTVTAPNGFRLTTARYVAVDGTCTTVGLPKARATAVSLFPNPTPGRTTLRVEQAQSPLTIHVRDATGRLVQSHYLAASANGQEVELDLSRRPKGLYLIQIVGSQGTFYRKLVVD